MWFQTHLHGDSFSNRGKKNLKAKHCGQNNFIANEYPVFISRSPWRNRLARSAVNRKVGGSSPPGDEFFFLPNDV